MSWTEAMKESADGAPREDLSNEPNVMRGTASTSWDPHEVWLTRVKQPRERAASRVTSNPESQVRRLPD